MPYNFHFSTHFIYATHAYFIIVLDRKNIPKEIRIKYWNELDLSNYAENPRFKKYKLIGVIMQEGDNYYNVIKNEKDDSYGNIEEWKIFKDDKVNEIIIDLSEHWMKIIEKFFTKFGMSLIQEFYSLKVLITEKN